MLKIQCWTKCINWLTIKLHPSLGFGHFNLGWGHDFSKPAVAINCRDGQSSNKIWAKLETNEYGCDFVWPLNYKSDISGLWTLYPWSGHYISMPEVAIKCGDGLWSWPLNSKVIIELHHWPLQTTESGNSLQLRLTMKLHKPLVSYFLALTIISSFRSDH